jgi:hypothetical protein
MLATELLQASQLLLKVEVQVTALDGQRFLVERFQVRVVLGQHPSHPAERSFFGVGQVPNDLDDGPLPGAGRRRSPASSTSATKARSTTGVARRVLRISWRPSNMASLPSHARRCWK